MLNLKMLGRHSFIWLNILFLAFPLYLAIVASTHDMRAMTSFPLPHYFGKDLFLNLKTLWYYGIGGSLDGSCATLLWNSFRMAFVIAVGKICLAFFTAFSLVYFAFPYKKLIFSTILVTLMLPIEVRLVPTFEVVLGLHGLNTLWALTMPLMVSASGIILFRDHFKQLPKNLVDAAKLDGAGPFRFLIDIALPLSKAPIGSLFVILFIYGWNQYLWPMVLITSPKATTMVVGMRYLSATTDIMPEWNLIMCMALIALIPPCLLLFAMEKSFERGLR
ncbi:MAG: glycerol-3-phosphate transporter [Legionellales bacterium RIFCSPHIGHO2_12_FULL_37_14]|nr:MAG: glycerol-3-phosphate transporter [Legionellales bacterium RIFCSPHIGHO2_12_FULL_37_14]